MTKRRTAAATATDTAADTDTETAAPKGKKTAHPRTHEGISELHPNHDGTAREVPLVNASGEYPKHDKKK